MAVQEVPVGGFDAFGPAMREPDPDGPWLTCEQSALLKALRAVKPALGTVGNHDPQELREGVRVVSDQFGANVWATSLRFAARADIDWLDGSNEPFDALVSHDALVQALIGLGRGPCTIEPVPDGGRCGLRIQADWQTVTLPGLNPERYPLAAPFDIDRELLTISAAALADAATRAAPLTDDPRTGRPLLTGCHLDLSEAPVLVATNSFELCALPLPATVATGAESVTVPAKALAAVGRNLKAAGDTTVTVGIAADAPGHGTDQHVAVLLGDGEVAWSLHAIDGTYPKWRNLVCADKPAVTLTLDLPELAEAAAHAVKMVPANHPTRLIVERDDVCLRGCDEKGYEFEQVLVEASCSPRRATIEIGVNARYLGHCVNALGAPTGTLQIVSAGRPVTLTAGDAIALLMPIRLTS